MTILELAESSKTMNRPKLTVTVNFPMRYTGIMYSQYWYDFIVLVK